MVVKLLLLWLFKWVKNSEDVSNCLHSGINLRVRKFSRQNAWPPKLLYHSKFIHRKFFNFLVFVSASIKLDYFLRHCMSWVEYGSACASVWVYISRLYFFLFKTFIIYFQMHTRSIINFFLSNEIWSSQSWPSCLNYFSHRKWFIKQQQAQSYVDCDRKFLKFCWQRRWNCLHEISASLNILKTFV